MSLDATISAISRIVDNLVGRRLDLLALYPASVVSQDGDDLDVICDNALLGGIKSIPIFCGTPGAKADVPDGTRVLVGFQEGDRGKPYVCLWGTSSAKPDKIVLDCDDIRLGKNAILGVARVGDTVQAGPFSGVITAGSTKTKAL